MSSLGQLQHQRVVLDPDRFVIAADARAGRRSGTSLSAHRRSSPRSSDRRKWARPGASTRRHGSSGRPSASMHSIWPLATAARQDLPRGSATCSSVLSGSQTSSVERHAKYSPCAIARRLLSARTRPMLSCRTRVKPCSSRSASKLALAAVGRAVVEDDQLDVGIGLFQHRLDGRAHEPPMVPAHQDRGDERLGRRRSCSAVVMRPPRAVARRMRRTTIVRRRA